MFSFALDEVMLNGKFFQQFFVEHIKLKNGSSSMILAGKSEHVEAEKGLDDCPEVAGH